jgi:hypothetical protein
MTTKRRKPAGRGKGKAADVGKYACTLKTLAPELAEAAAELAISINPVNAPNVGAALMAMAPDIADDRGALSALTQRTWGARADLTVGFMGNVKPALAQKITSFANKWGDFCAVKFTLIDRPDAADIRISLGAGGYWSYLGTDCRMVPRTQQTMNLQGFTEATLEREFHRVVKHEFGHALGFPHEHARAEVIALLDEEKVIDYFWRTQGWSAQMVRQQILTPLETRAVIATPVADETSIMTYSFPGQLTKSGRPILGGLDFSAMDREFAPKIYRPAEAPPPPPATAVAVAFRVEGSRVVVKLGAGLTGVFE